MKCLYLARESACGWRLREKCKRMHFLPWRGHIEGQGGGLGSHRPFWVVLQRGSGLGCTWSSGCPSPGSTYVGPGASPVGTAEEISNGWQGGSYLKPQTGRCGILLVALTVAFPGPGTVPGTQWVHNN